MGDKTAIKSAMSEERHRHWMEQALLLARDAEAAGEVPVGAILVDPSTDLRLGGGFNQPVGQHDPTAHAEIVALRDAARHMGNYRLPGTVMYVTIEPCTMCLGAMIHARVELVVFGAREPRAGAVVSQGKLLQDGFFNHQLDFLEGVLGEECASMIQRFFAQKRRLPDGS